MNAAEPSESRLVRHSLLLIGVMGVANLANVLFHMAMGRMLTTADYGVLMAMYSVLYVLNVPAETLRTAVTYFAAKEHTGEEGKDFTARMFFQATRRLLLLAIPVLVAFGLASPLLVRFFNLEGYGPVLATALACLFTVMMTTLHGVLLGRQEFSWYGSSMGLWFGGRLLLAILLVWVGFRATGALAGMACGALLALVLPYAVLRKGLLRRDVHERVDSAPIYRYVIKALVAYGAFVLLGKMDVIATKHFFAPVDAGVFAQASLPAHFTWLIPMPIVMAMFPKAVRPQNSTERLQLLWKSIALCLGIVALLFVVLVGGARWIFALLFASPEHAMIPLMSRYVLAMIPLALTFVFMNFEMSANRFVVCVPMALAVVAMAVGLMMSHQSPLSVIRVVTWVNVVTCTVLGLVSVTHELRSQGRASVSP